MTARRETRARDEGILRGAIAVRAFTERARGNHAPPRATRRRKETEAPSRERWPTAVLLFDTETTTDSTQRLLFGSYRYCRWNGAALDCVDEGLFHADELPVERPEEFAVLADYTARNRLKLIPRHWFVRRKFYPVACEARGIVAGFNLPFDLSRLAIDHGEARGRYRGGFSFALVDYLDPGTASRRENTYYARVCVKHLDSKRAFMGLTGGREPHKGKGVAARFLDIKTLAFALTNKGHSLASACEAFGVVHGKASVGEHGRITPDYVEYNRRDVLATQELLERLRTEFDRHPIALEPWKAQSPASIAKAHLNALGVQRSGHQFNSVPPKVLGYAMSAYYGGRAECRVRNVAVPVVYADFLSMYPTVNALMGLWRLLTAERLKIVDATQDICELFGAIDLAQCFKRDTWPGFRFFAEVIPHDEILPTRAQYSAASDAWNIGVNGLSAEFPLWFAGPDLIASTLLTGKAPQIRRAFRIVPHGQQETLRPVKLGGDIAIDPSHTDFFRAVIEQRKGLKNRGDLSEDDRTRLDQFLKVLANSGSYGVFAQMNTEDRPQDDTVGITVHGLDGPFACRTHSPETAGPFCFPPIAALITSAARLMLAMLERCVTDAGGEYALCDTDSMAIIATEHDGTIACPGGAARGDDGQETVRALSWAGVAQIVDRFAQLNPYNPAIVPGSILKIEDENYRDGRQRQIFALAISAKRYALFERTPTGEIAVLKASEHGLGHLLNPIDPSSTDRDWIRQTWHWLIAQTFGERVQAKDWLDRPAISRITISSPALLRPFSGGALAYRDRVKPFNFALSAHVAPLGHPPGVDPTRFHLVAPFERDSRKWTKLPWIDAYSRNQYEIATGVAAPVGTVRVKSYRDTIALYATHPEAKSADPDQRECDRTTIGLLGRRRVQATSLVYVGKESNRIEEVELGLVHSWDTVISTHVDAETEWNARLLPALRRMPRREAARRLGLSERAVSALRSGKVSPSQRTVEALRKLG